MSDSTVTSWEGRANPRFNSYDVQAIARVSLPVVKERLWYSIGDVAAYYGSYVAWLVLSHMPEGYVGFEHGMQALTWPLRRIVEGNEAAEKMFHMVVDPIYMGRVPLYRAVRDARMMVQTADPRVVRALDSMLTLLYEIKFVARPTQLWARGFMDPAFYGEISEAEERLRVEEFIAAFPRLRNEVAYGGE